MQSSTVEVETEHDVRPEVLRDAKPAHPEVCPLCLGRYAAALECICAACEAPSCPECAVTIEDTTQVLCYACHVPTTH